MKRREFVRGAAALGALSLLPRCVREGKTMLFGDMLQRLAEGETLTSMELLELQRLGNAFHERDTVLSSWIGVDGSLNVPHINAGGGIFETLPHEAASLTFDELQTITHNTTTTPAIDASSIHTWAKNLEIDTSNGKIHLTGVDRGAIFLVNTWCEWSNDNMTAFIYVIDSGETISEYLKDFVYMEGQGHEFCKVTRLWITQTDNDYFYARVHQVQSSGSADAILGYGQLQVLRLR